MNIFKFYVFIFLFISSLVSFSQNKAVVFGKITDQENKPIHLANITAKDMAGGATTDKDGNYRFEIPANTKITIVISFIGYESEEVPVNLSSGEEKRINISLIKSSTELPDFEIRDKEIRNTSLSRVNPKTISVIPSVSGGVESVIKTLPGVSSSNELSSQYSVRGGNFDENLVYVNGIEIYRPFLVRSGQQEGLSFINSSMVSSILFSAGGFDAKYGDKMSSVLDIQYRKPLEFGGSFGISLLGGEAFIEGITKNRKFSYLLGVRQKSNQSVLSGLDTKGDYQPSFTDVQTLLRYDLSKKTELSFLGHYARNVYKFVPSDRETDFGTFQDAHRVKIYFDGQEKDKFETFFGALSLNHLPHKDLKLTLTASAFKTYERENFDIQGQYWIGRLEADYGSLDDEVAKVIQSEGVGTYLNHARNKLNASVYNIEHKGTWNKSDHFIQWGIKYQHENIDDNVSEWDLIDSAGYSLPNPAYDPGNPNPPHPSFKLYYSLKTDNNISSNRYTAFIQDAWSVKSNNSVNLTVGLRVNYWDFNKELILSPRATISFKPNWKKDIVLRFSSGFYYQPVFFREMRDMEGVINEDIKAQKSIHFVLGSDWNFYIWSRPFKFTTEIYYKFLDDLIPYEVDNVRIRYYAKNNSHGYAAGIDMKINGEFVKGIDSWASLSVMKTMEDIKDDFYYDYYNKEGELIVPGITFDNAPVDSTKVEPGYIPRPTDQRVNFSLFFQDYLPNNPTWKMHLSLFFGSSLPFGPPNSPRYKHTLRMPTYRRVDIGFSKQLKGENTVLSPKNPFRYLKSVWITAEIFNLFQISNTISYFWITGVNGGRYAVPNYLTPRQLNVKLIVKF